MSPLSHYPIILRLPSSSGGKPHASLQAEVLLLGPAGLLGSDKSTYIHHDFAGAVEGFGGFQVVTVGDSPVGIIIRIVWV